MESQPKTQPLSPSESEKKKKGEKKEKKGISRHYGERKAHEAAHGSVCTSFYDMGESSQH